MDFAPAKDFGTSGLEHAFNAMSVNVVAQGCSSGGTLEIKHRALLHLLGFRSGKVALLQVEMRDLVFSVSRSTASLA